MIELSSRTWVDVTAYVNKRVAKLEQELCEETFTHTPEKDTARRAARAELLQLVKTLVDATKPKPENQDE